MGAILPTLNPHALAFVEGAQVCQRGLVAAHLQAVAEHEEGRAELLSTQIVGQAIGAADRAWA
ncbi:hypothetical protein D3C80_1259440 [compost metagenome]